MTFFLDREMHVATFPPGHKLLCSCHEPKSTTLPEACDRFAAYDQSGRKVHVFVGRGYRAVELAGRIQVYTERPTVLRDTERNHLSWGTV